jgi:hypothetical protein
MKRHLFDELKEGLIALENALEEKSRYALIL